MKKNRMIGLFLVGAVLLAACTKKAEKQAQLRIGQFLMSRNGIKIQITNNKLQAIDTLLKYPSLTDYREYKPGRYRAMVFMGNKKILEKEIGLGKGKFTLCLFGIPDTSLSVNYQTRRDKLHTVFAGSEAHTPNGDKPKLKLLTDNFQQGDDEAQIRWFNFAPGLCSLDAKAVVESGGESTKLSMAEYPEMIENKVLEPGYYTFSWKIDGSPSTAVSIVQKIDAGKIYSFFVLGLPGQYSDSLQVITGITEGER